MIQINRTGGNYAKNIINPVFYFENNETWNTTGTGSASVSIDNAFFGTKSLKIDNTGGATLTVSISSKDSEIPNTGKYGFALYLKQDAAASLSGKVNIFKNGAALLDEDFDIENIGAWFRYSMESEMDLIRGDKLTFTFELNGVGIVYMDGLMIYAKDRLQESPPLFNYDKTALLQNDIVSVEDNSAKIWTASNGGTIDSIVYEKGDLLVTSKSGGTQKTALLVDFSAI